MMYTNYSVKHNEMKQEAIEKIIETLENGFSGYYCDLHNEVFNTDYYIVGTFKAKEALKEYDVFDAIAIVQRYENDNFGEVYTDVSNPEKLINMLFYIVGDEIVQEMFTAYDEDIWSENADEETNAKLIEMLKEYVITPNIIFAE